MQNKAIFYRELMDEYIYDVDGFHAIIAKGISPLTLALLITAKVHPPKKSILAVRFYISKNTLRANNER